MKRNASRRNYFIKKDLQGKFVLSYFLFVIIGSLVFVSILAFFAADTLTIVYDNNNLELGRTGVVLLKRILSAHWVFIVFGGLVIVVGAILLTHRIAGPMYRFEQTLEEMKKGNIGLTARLRNGDEGQELADKINEFNVMLAARLKEMRELVASLEAELLVLAGRKGDTSSLGQTLTTIRKLQVLLGTFTLKND